MRKFDQIMVTYSIEKILEMRFREIPFPKNIIHSDVVLDKLRQRFRFYFRSLKRGMLNSENCCGRSHWQVLKMSRILKYLKPCKRKLKIVC